MAMHCLDCGNSVMVDGDVCDQCREPLLDNDDEFGQTIVRPAAGKLRGPQLELADGRRVTLDRPAAFGRDPRSDDGVQAVRVDDPEMSVSKTHLKVTYREDAVWVVDLRSTNGVRAIQPNGAEVWLEPGEPTRIHPGTRVCFGSQSFLLAAPARPAPPSPTMKPEASAPQVPAVSGLIAAVPSASDGPVNFTPPSTPTRTFEQPVAPPVREEAAPVQYAEEPLPDAAPQANPYPQVSIRIGDLRISDDTIITPVGTAPLKGSMWTMSEQLTERSYIEQSTIIWAIVLSMFCGLGLLLLLKRKQEISGTVVVSVASGHVRSSTAVKVAEMTDLENLRTLVAQVQAMAV